VLVLLSVVAIAGTFLGVLLVSWLGRSDVNDSWGEHQRGAMFTTSAPSGFTDRSLLTYSSPGTGQGDIYAVSSGASPVRLTNSPDYEASPVCTSDGRMIAFTRETKGFAHLWLMRSDGSGKTQLTSEFFHDWPVAFSRNGSFLLFNRIHRPRFGNGNSVESFVTPVTVGGRLISVGIQTCFSADGRSVISTDDLKSLWELDLHSPSPAKRPFPGRGFPISVSHDGKYLLTGRFSAGSPGFFEHEIWWLDLDSKHETKVGVGSYPIIINQTKPLLLYLGMPKQQLLLYDVAEGKTTPLDMPPGHRLMRQSVDGNGALFAIFPRFGVGDYEVFLLNGTDLSLRKVASVF
jgi:hypothetical protein